MKKSDLKDGMYVELRDFGTCLLLNGHIVSKISWLLNIKEYSEDLLCIGDTFDEDPEINEGYDIIKVGIRKPKNYGIFDEQAIDWIWTRPTLKYKVGDLFITNINDLKYKVVKVLDNKYEMAVSYIDNENFTPSCGYWTDEEIDKRMTPYKEPVIKEITMEELEKDYGCKVKIIK